MNASRPFLICLWATLSLLADSVSAQRISGGAVPNEILVKFAASVSSARRNARLATTRARVVRHFDELDIDHLVLPAGTDVQSAVKNLLASGDVMLAQPNYLRHLDLNPPPNEPSWLEGQLWGLLKVQAQPAWIQSGGGDGSVVLASLDTGVDYTHPDLAANIWQNPGEIPGNGIDDDGDGYIDDVHGIDTVNHDSDPMDDEGHGTHTTGIMAAIGNNGLGVVGVCWKAKIVICKCFDRDGEGTDAEIIECLNYLVALKHRGVNLRASNNSYSGKLLPTESFPSALQAAFDAAGAAGILNVCAAGNDGTNSDSDPTYPAAFDSPSIVTVGATDQDDNRVDFSNFGATTVDLAAPGLVIFSTIFDGSGAQYGNLSGTSMSTPFVTGAVAILSQINPAASPATLKSLLLNNADLVPQWTGLSVSGGRLNVARAAQAAAAGTAPFQINFVNRLETGAFELDWPAVPGVRYQVVANTSLTSDFISLSDVIVAGAGGGRLSFTDLAASGPRKFYRVDIVP